MHRAVPEQGAARRGAVGWDPGAKAGRAELRLWQFEGRVVLAYIVVGENGQVKVASLQDQGKAEWFVRVEGRDGRG